MASYHYVIVLALFSIADASTGRIYGQDYVTNPEYLSIYRRPTHDFLGIMTGFIQRNTDTNFFVINAAMKTPWTILLRKEVIDDLKNISIGNGSLCDGFKRRVPWMPCNVTWHYGLTVYNFTIHPIEEALEDFTDVCQTMEKQCLALNSLLRDNNATNDAEENFIDDFLLAIYSQKNFCQAIIKLPPGMMLKDKLNLEVGVGDYRKVFTAVRDGDPTIIMGRELFSTLKYGANPNKADVSNTIVEVLEKSDDIQIIMNKLMTLLDNMKLIRYHGKDGNTITLYELIFGRPTNIKHFKYSEQIAENSRSSRIREHSRRITTCRNFLQLQEMEERAFISTIVEYDWRRRLNGINSERFYFNKGKDFALRTVNTTYPRWLSYYEKYTQSHLAARYFNTLNEIIELQNSSKTNTRDRIRLRLLKHERNTLLYILTKGYEWEYTPQLIIKLFKYYIEYIESNASDSLVLIEKVLRNGFDCDLDILPVIQKNILYSIGNCSNELSHVINSFRRIFSHYKKETCGLNNNYWNSYDQEFKTRFVKQRLDYEGMYSEDGRRIVFNEDNFWTYFPD